MPFAVQALAKYAFGLGTVTMVLTTLVFTGMSLPPGQGLGTQIMVKVTNIFHSALPLIQGEYGKLFFCIHCPKV